MVSRRLSLLRSDTNAQLEATKGCIVESGWRLCVAGLPRLHCQLEGQLARHSESPTSHQLTTPYGNYASDHNHPALYFQGNAGIKLTFSG